MVDQKYYIVNIIISPEHDNHLFTPTKNPSLPPREPTTQLPQRKSYELQQDAEYANFRLNSVFVNELFFCNDWRVDEKVEFLFQKYNEVCAKSRIVSMMNGQLEIQIQEENEICTKLTEQNEELKEMIQNRLEEILLLNQNEIQQALTKIKNQQNYIIQELKQQSLQQTEEKTKRVKELQDTVKSIRERNEQILSRQQGA